MQLSEDQELALQTILKSIRSGNKVSVLCGPAGTGKTTLIRELTARMRDEGWFVFWAAPTGKAASRISQITGEPASTIHSLLYKRVVEGRKGQPIFQERRTSLLDGRQGLLIVDEASMVGMTLYRHLLEAAGSTVLIVFVGDREQVPPVADEPGPDLEHPTAELTVVHRQALESPILRVATDVRSKVPLVKGKIGDQYERKDSSVYDVSEWLCSKIRDQRDSVVLCATNSVRSAINRLVRRELGFSDLVCVGERLVVGLNNKDLGRMNGEIFSVDEVRPVMDEEGDETKLLWVRSGEEIYFVHSPSIGKDVLDFKKATRSRLGLVRNPSFWLHVDYGYALTVHRAQGSEWDDVCFVIDGKLKWRAKLDPDQIRKIVYTAITRARKTLQVADV